MKSIINQLETGDIANGNEFIGKFESVIGKDAFDKLKMLVMDRLEVAAQPNDVSSVCGTIRGSFHQGDLDVFVERFAGVQCCTMALAFIIQTSILSPTKLSEGHLNQVLLEGNKIYQNIIDRSDVDDIPNSGFLNVKNFDVIKSDLEIFGRGFELIYNEDPEIYGTINETEHDEGFPISLKKGLKTLFQRHMAGILIANDRSFAVIKDNGSYFFFDSHGCDENGVETNLEGVACAIECNSIDQLEFICKRATGTNNEPFTLDFLDIVMKIDEE